MCVWVFFMHESQVSYRGSGNKLPGEARGKTICKRINLVRVNNVQLSYFDSEALKNDFGISSALRKPHNHNICLFSGS